MAAACCCRLFPRGPRGVAPDGDAVTGATSRKVPQDATRRRQAALAGHRGDEAAARSLLGDLSAPVRATALGSLSRMGLLTRLDLETALADADPTVRRRAGEVAGANHTIAVNLVPTLDDADPAVVEVACWALGERGDVAGLAAVARLSEIAIRHPDPLCREAAVAALGAIGHPDGLAAILTATTDKPPVRRRAVLALAPFEGPEVDEALERALTDRDWQVRQAAEDLTT